MNDCYVYSHHRKDNNEIFYVGISKGKKPYRRAFSNKKRNPHWINLVNKQFGFIVEIISENISWLEACEQEIKLIKQYGRSDLGTGILCNQTDGGDGAYGRKMSEKCREVSRKKNIGNKYALGIRFNRPEDTKKKMRKPKSEDHKNNISKGKMGLKLSSEALAIRRNKILQSKKFRSG